MSEFTQVDAGEIAETLADALRSGDTPWYATLDGWQWRARMSPDDDLDLRDEDWFGSFSGWTRDRQRPNGFTGAAAVVAEDRGARIWWQPPAEVKPGTENYRRLYYRVRGFFSGDWQYTSVLVECRTPECEHGRRGEGRASLGGVESDADDGYLLDVLRDLVMEARDDAGVTS